MSFWYRAFGEEEGDIKQETCRLTDFLIDNAACAASVFRKEAWIRCGGYDETLKTGFEDWDFWVSILTSGFRAYIIKEFLFKYRVRGDARHHTCDSAESRKKLFKILIKKHKKAFHHRLAQYNPIIKDLKNQEW